MNEKIMISLVGEQPIPNLLAVLNNKPERSVFVCTEFTKEKSRYLYSVLKERSFLVEDEPIIVEPYNMVDIETKMKEYIKKKGWSPDKILLNLTGGTKPMALTAYRLAEQLSCPFIYVDSYGKSTTYYYRFSEQGPELENFGEVPPLMDIDLYLKSFLDGYTESKEFKNDFERIVYEALRQELDEVKNSVKPVPLGGLEIDLVLRCGNLVGIAEVKTGSEASRKKGIEQIITASEQRFLGTYTKKFLILDREYETNNRQLAKAHQIEVIELPSGQRGELSDEDKRKLCNKVKKRLGG